MLICGLQKLSLLDYPGKLAATIFTGGCNLRCPFCHNALLVTRVSESPVISEEELFTFLNNRAGKLDGVCITGGEPLLQKDLESFILKIKDLGFLGKLDTNGCFPDRLRRLLDKGIIDYVAMDIKNSPEKYALTVGIEGFDPAPVFESAKLLMNGSTPYEFRTTLAEGLHTAEDMEKIGELLHGANQYFLQSFIDSGSLVGFDGNHEGFLGTLNRSDIERFRDILSGHIPSVSIRG